MNVTTITTMTWPALNVPARPPANRSRSFTIPSSHATSITLGHSDFGQLAEDRSHKGAEANPDSGGSKEPQCKFQGIRVHRVGEYPEPGRNEPRANSHEQHPGARPLLRTPAEDEVEDFSDQHRVSPEEHERQRDDEDAPVPSVEHTQQTRDDETARIGGDGDDGGAPATVH